MRRAIHSRVVRAVSSAAAGLLVAGALVGVTATPAPATGGSVLHKSAQNITHHGSGQADHGDEVNWVLDYTGNGSTGPATITDPISGAGAAQAYVPGSLKTPPGWTPSWSTDGTTFQGTDAGAATAAVRATNPGASQGGTSLSADLLPPLKAVATATGGDGFTPILYRARTARWRPGTSSTTPTPPPRWSSAPT